MHLVIVSDGTLDWAATVPTDIVGDVTGLTVNRGTLAGATDVLVDLLAGAAPFDALSGTASGQATIPAADASALASDPAMFFMTLFTSSTPPISSALGAFTALEWHAALRGSEEVQVIDANARGGATFRLPARDTVQFVIAMSRPVITDLQSGHIHVGGPGVNGGIVVNLDLPAATVDAANGTMSGSVPITLAQLSRITANLAGFYCNVHTVAAPNGVARGQLASGTVEFWAALKGDEEVDVIDANARGGFTLELDSFTSGKATLAVPSDTQGIDDLTGAHVHVGAAGVNGGILFHLNTGADYNTSPLTGSADGSVVLTQAQFARLLANPRGFYANFHTMAAPNGLVRGQLTRNPVTFFGDLSGANETTPVTGAGALTALFTGVHVCAFTITMQDPPAGDLTAAHIHDGPAGVDGPPIVSLLDGSDVVVAGNTITGQAPAPGRTFARLLASPELFYGNVHTAAVPAGVARDQLVHVTGDTPPAGLTYASPVVYQTGTAIMPNSPSSVGGAVTSYSIVPPLPAGLTLNTTTGIISGTPTATQAATDHTVTASNDAGSTGATVNITVNVGPPTNLQYSTPVTYVVGTAITPNTPTNQGGAIASYSVSPPLPGGINLNTATGVITGTPTTATAAANYTVTGTNAAGMTQAVINITVQQSLQPPSNLSYATPVVYETGNAISPNSPTVTGTVSSYSVSPALPSGLSLNTTTGVISGTPTAVTAAANYTVTASNAAGSTQATVNIEVKLGKPGAFTYSNNPNLGYKNAAINSMSPTHMGGGAVSSYSISPTLVAGLTINTTTGVISGTPTALDESGTTYTVTASNSAGNTTTTVTIQVLP